MPILPGGFSPLNAAKQLASYTPLGAAYSQIRGGDATPNFNIFTPQGGNAKPNQSAPNQSAPNSLGGVAQDNATGNYVQNDPNASARAAQAKADSQAKDSVLYSIQSGIDSANSNLGRLDNQLNTGYGNIDRQYQDAYGRLVGQRQKTEADYNTQTNEQLNQYQAARTQGETAARGFLDNARRTLGAQGAGGGSAARYGLPYEAQQQVAASNSQAQSVNNRNLSSLIGNYNQAKTDFSNSENDLQRQREQGRNDTRSRIDQQRAELLNTVGTLSGQKTIANGGDFRAAQAASQPYTSKIASILANIDGLAATPNIREQQVNVGRPDLSGYSFTAPEAPVATIQDPSLSGNVIYGQQDQQQDPILSLFGLDNPYKYA